jgi:hypothetical protein
MWARVRLAARGALARGTAALGTWPVSAALLALIGLYQLILLAWERWGPEETAEALAGRWPFWALYGLAALDALAALVRDVPACFPHWFTSSPPPRPRRQALASLARLATHAAWLLLAVGLLASLGARDRFTLWAAVGEEFQGAPGQYLTRARPRPWSPGPRRVGFTVLEVEPALDQAGRLDALSVGLALAGRTERLGRWRPVWLGGGRFLLTTGYGYAPHLEVTDPQGQVVERTIAKLALLPPGHSDHVRSDGFAHRLHFRLPEGVSRRGGQAGLADLELQVDVFRGKLQVAAGRLRPGGALEFEGLTLRMPEVRYWAEFTLVDDPGLPVIALAALALLVGAGLGLASRRRGA